MITQKTHFLTLFARGKLSQNFKKPFFYIFFAAIRDWEYEMGPRKTGGGLADEGSDDMGSDDMGWGDKGLAIRDLSPAPSRLSSNLRHPPDSTNLHPPDIPIV